MEPPFFASSATDHFKPDFSTTCKNPHYHTIRENLRAVVLASRLPSLNGCVVTKQTFCIILLRLVLIKFRCFVSRMGFSNEDNCCQLQGIGKLIKEKLLKGIFKVV